jgi:hypothetical protein
MEHIKNFPEIGTEMNGIFLSGGSGIEYFYAPYFFGVPQVGNWLYSNERKPPTERVCGFLRFVNWRVLACRAACCKLLAVSGQKRPRIVGRSGLFNSQRSPIRPTRQAAKARLWKQ